MTVSLARLLSLLLNPIFLLILVPYVVVYRSTADSYLALNWTIYTVFFLFIMGIFLLVCVKKGIFTDMDVSKREQRPLLFMVSIGLGIVYLAGLYAFEAPIILFKTISGIIVGIFLASLINNHIKASMHVATMTAMIVAFVIGYGGWYYLLLLIIPILAWARIKIKRHTLPETIVGGFFGAALALTLYLLIKFISY